MNDEVGTFRRVEKAPHEMMLGKTRKKSAGDGQEDWPQFTGATATRVRRDLA